MISPIQIELPTVFETMTVNSWLIKGPEPVLIDCGEKSEKSWEALIVGLQKEGLKIQDIRKVFITHAHLDHIGMAAKITEHSDAEIWVSEYAYDWAVKLEEMLDRREVALKSAFDFVMPGSPFLKESTFGYKTLSPYWDEIPADRVKTFPMDGTVQFGDKDWEVIYVPGHCINQTCFYQRESQQLFSADMLLRMIAPPIIDAEIEAPYSRTMSLAMHVTSYQKLLDLPIGQVYPGHYQSFEGAHELIQRQLLKIESRKTQCLDLISEGVKDFQKLWESIYPGRLHPPSFLMVLGVIDLLLEEGKIARKELAGKVVFELN